MGTDATTGIIAIETGVETAGAIAFWRLSGSTNHQRLVNEWTARGLDVKLVPSLPTPEVALRAACHEQQETRILIRPLEKRAGYSVVREKASGDDLAWGVLLRAKVDVIGQLHVEPGEVPQTPEQLSARVAKLNADFTSHMQTIPQARMSGWLVDLATRVAAVRLRDTGGIYFVPRPALDEWREMVRAIRAASSHAVFEIPSMRSDEAVAAILDAITQEAETALAALEKELAEGDLGGRALENRANEARALKGKVSTYEKLLGKKMDAMQASLENIAANLTAAALAKTAAEEDARAARAA